jgi:hypothetical protein
MSWLLDLRLIRFFSFYLALVFLLSTYLRVQQYWTIVALARRLPQRWPNLLGLLRQHVHILVTWETLRPLVVVAVLFTANTLAAQLIWPQADEFKVADLLLIWPLLPLVLGSALAMGSFDAYGTLQVGVVDREETEKYLDQAEYWLRGWKAPVVHLLSLGYVNPRQIVAQEVRTALESTTQLVNSTLWWVSIQTGLRIAFGLSLWGSYALEGWLRHLLGT